MTLETPEPPEPQLDQKLRALGSGSRLTLLSIMRATDTLTGSRGWTTAGYLAKVSGLSAQSLNKHMTKLVDAEIVDRKRSGRTSLYRVRPKAFQFLTTLPRLLTLPGETDG